MGTLLLSTTDILGKDSEKDNQQVHEKQVLEASGPVW